MRSGTALKHRLSIKLPEQNKLQQNVLPSTMWGKNRGLWLWPWILVISLPWAIICESWRGPGGGETWIGGARRPHGAGWGEWDRDKKPGTGKITAWHQGPVSGLGQRQAFFQLKGVKICVVLRQAVHLKTGISQFMNAGFCNSRCRLMQFLCVILFVCVVVVLKEPSHDYGSFMQIGRQTLFQRICTVRLGMCQTLRARVVPF